MKQKKRAGSILGILFGIVCLFSGCGKEKAVFMAGVDMTEEANIFDISNDVFSLESEIASDENTDMVKAEVEIVVYVCGQVKNPGLYTLRAGDRMGDAIEMAGGMTEEAAKESINLARLAEDGQMIRVFSQKEIEELGEDLSDEGSELLEGARLAEVESSGTDSDGKISLNRATKEQLMTLPGIGESKADAILRYREEKGGFSSVEELKNISGIKEGVLSKIRDQVTI